jgi:hypothetical protein
LLDSEEAQQEEWEFLKLSHHHHTTQITLEHFLSRSDIQSSFGAGRVWCPAHHIWAGTWWKPRNHFGQAGISYPFMSFPHDSTHSVLRPKSIQNRATVFVGLSAALSDLNLCVGRNMFFPMHRCADGCTAGEYRASVHLGYVCTGRTKATGASVEPLGWANRRDDLWLDMVSN